MDAASVRIDATLLQEYQGRLVRIIGKCESFDPSSSHGTILSNGPITIISAPGELLSVSKNYEIIGKVGSNDLKVRVLSAIELSDNVNLDHAEKLVKYVHKVPELFY